MFLKPENSDTENMALQNQKCHLKQIMYNVNWKPRKMKCTRITRL